MHKTAEIHIPDQPIPSSRRCHHREPEGRRCGSPSMRGESFCYHHHQTRRPVANVHLRRARQSKFSLPEPGSRAEIQQAIGTIMLRIANNDIDLRRAGLLLYALQIANSNLTAFQRQNTQTATQPAATSDLISTPSHPTPCHPEQNTPSGSTASSTDAESKDLRSEPSSQSNPQTAASTGFDPIPVHYGSGPTPDLDHPSTERPENRIDFTPPPPVWRRLARPVGATLLETFARSAGIEPLPGSPYDRKPAPLSPSEDETSSKAECEDSATTPVQGFAGKDTPLGGEEDASGDGSEY